jgi:hypothetical protein
VAKKKGRARVLCPGCGSKLKTKDIACRRCGTRRPGGLAASRSADKALFVPGDGAPAFLVKAARPRCPSPRCGAVSTRPGAKHCTRCGAPLGLRVVKSAGDVQREVFMRDLCGSPDPAVRESLWRAAHPEIYGKGSTAS